MNTDTTTYYKKEEDGTYTPIQEYDPNFMDSLPFGIHMVDCKQGSQIRIYHLNPDHITLWASAYLLRNKLESVVEDIYQPGIIPEPYTPEQEKAYAALKKTFDKDTFELKFPSNREVADKLCELLVELIDDEIKGNSTLRSLWEKYNATVALCK